MGLSKLTQGHIAIIGLVLALVIGGTFYFLGPYKTDQNLAALQTRESEADTRLAKERANKEDLAKAQQEVKQVEAQFARYERRLMPQPPIDLTKPTDETAMTKAMLRLWRQPYELVTAANQFARQQARRNKVTLLSPSFSVGGQTTDPAAIPTNILVFPMGTLQVSGSFENVNDFFRAWNRFKRVVAVDGLQLSVGPNPAGGASVVGQANVTAYVYPRANPGQGGPTAEDPYGAGGGAGGGSALPPGYGPPPAAPGGA